MRLVTTILLMVVAMYASVTAEGVDYETTTLDLVTTSEDRRKLSVFFPEVYYSGIIVIRCGIDGKGGVLGQTFIRERSYSSVIFLDSADFPEKFSVNYFADGKSRRAILHEMWHLKQSKRGREYRKTIVRQVETLEYKSRPAESEAYFMESYIDELWTKKEP